MKISKHIFFFFILAVSAGCSRPAVNSYSEYLKWMGQPENGLVKIKYVNGIEVKVKYLPSEYLAYRELKSEATYSQKQKDSLLQVYANSLCFVMSLGPDERTEQGSDIMFRSLNSYKEYAERVYDMNFFMEEHVLLKAGENEYRPVLSQMENTYEASTKRNIIFVFVPKEKTDKSLDNADQLEFKYSDDQFNLGVNYFVFKKTDINNIPSIKFWNSRG